jgi:hypothetical protein
MTVGPVITYERVIADIEGDHAVAAWAELRDALEHRPGWQFRLIDGYPSWQRAQQKVWATVDARRGRPATFVVWRGGRSADDASWWESATVVGLLELLDRLERRRRARSPDGSTIPSAANGQHGCYG